MKRRTFVNAAASVTAAIALAGCTDTLGFGGSDSLPVSVDNRDDTAHTVTVTIRRDDGSEGEPTFEGSVEVAPGERVEVTQIDGIDYSITAKSDTGRESQNSPSSAAEAVIIYVGDGGNVEITSLATN